MTLKLAIIGYGEVGQLFARQLAAKPGVAVAVSDILFADPSSSRKMSRLAAESNVHAAAKAPRRPAAPISSCRR